MEYMGDKQYWDEKFISRNDYILNPEQSLVDNVSYFKKDTILDLACGDGRNTIFLLKKGFKITGVDFSNEALERLKCFSKRSNYAVNTICLDLSKPNSLDNIGIFDNIIINHYRLNKAILSEINKHISDNGTLFICGFGHKHKVDSKIKESDLIVPSDFEDIKKKFKLIKYIEKEDKRGFLVTYIFWKNSN